MQKLRQDVLQNSNYARMNIGNTKTLNYFKFNWGVKKKSVHQDQFEVVVIGDSNIH